MVHKTQLTVRYAETDMMGVVHHSNYPIWAEYARTRMLSDMGYPYSQVEKDGIMLPVTEMLFQFKNPCFFEDPIVVESAVVLLDNRRLKVAYKIFRDKDLLCCKGYTKHIFMGAESRRSVRIGDEVLEAYQKYYLPEFEKHSGSSSASL